MGEDARRAAIGDLFARRSGRAVVLGLGWWSAALGSIALASVSPSNRVAGMIVFGATVFGALCALLAPIGLDRRLRRWLGARLVAVALGFGVVAGATRHLLAPEATAVVAYTRTPAEIPTVAALAVGSFALLYAIGGTFGEMVHRGRNAIWDGESRFGLRFESADDRPDGGRASDRANRLRRR